MLSHMKSLSLAANQYSPNNRNKGFIENNYATTEVMYVTRAGRA